MAWNATITWTLNQVVTSAQLNAQIRDNMNLTPAALATVSGSIFAGNGANAVAERIPTDNSVDTSETTATTSFVSLTTNGPVVTVTSGTSMLVWIGCWVENTGASGSYASYEISGATTLAAGDARTVISAGAIVSAGRCYLQAVTAGSNTVRMMYRVGGGTGTFRYRRLTVMPL